MKHIFNNHCIDFVPLLQEQTLGGMIKVAHDQSRTAEAMRRLGAETNDDNKWSPKYFGLFVEWLAEFWLNHYGQEEKYNLYEVKMEATVGNIDDDYGVDGMGKTLKGGKHKKALRKIEKDGPVYIQVKGALNKNKIHEVNDGSRLGNFGTNAMSSAVLSGNAYKSRYVLFTTGKGVLYTVNNMFNGMLEVIGYDDFAGRMDNDTVFLNKLRTSVGLPQLQPTLLKAETDPT